jgi:hypothetical protein
LIADDAQTRSSLANNRKEDTSMPIVGPIKETHVPLVYDGDDRGLGGPIDMNGPQIGITAYSAPGDNLHLQINVEFALPSTKYEVFLTAGPSHALASGFIGIGVLTTNGVGAGVGTFTVPHATLLAAPFGAGYRTDHIDLLRAAGNLAGGVLVTGAVNYFVCSQREKDGGDHPGIAAFEAHKGKIGKGDAVGSHLEKSH